MAWSVHGQDFLASVERQDAHGSFVMDCVLPSLADEENEKDEQVAWDAELLRDCDELSFHELLLWILSVQILEFGKWRVASWLQSVPARNISASKRCFCNAGGNRVCTGGVSASSARQIVSYCVSGLQVREMWHMRASIGRQRPEFKQSGDCMD